jgi:hypothetical protein
MLLVDRPSVSIVALLRKRNNVLLVHCCSSANVTEPREPHTCNNIKDSFYEELSVFDQFPRYDMKILLGGFNAKVDR